MGIAELGQYIRNAVGGSGLGNLDAGSLFSLVDQGEGAAKGYAVITANRQNDYTVLGADSSDAGDNPAGGSVRKSGCDVATICIWLGRC